MMPRAGLVLTGGGARAAYQVGVLKAVRDILGSPVKNPFPIVCGTSAGAINAAALAASADDFTRGVGKLLEFLKDILYQAYVRRGKLQQATMVRRFFVDEAPDKITPIGRAAGQTTD